MIDVPQESRSHIFDNSVRALIENNLDYVTTTCTEGFNIEAAHFLDDKKRYQLAYIAQAVGSSSMRHGLVITKQLQELRGHVVNYGPNSPIVGQRHYQHPSSAQGIRRIDHFPGGVRNEWLPDADISLPGTDSIPVRADMVILEADIGEIHTLTPVRAVSIARPMINSLSLG